MKYAQSLGMLVTAFSPLGHGQSYAPLGYGNKVAIKVIMKYRKTVDRFNCYIICRRRL